MDRRQKIGRLGEYIAEKYLIKNNYIILEKNYRCKYGELDIIAYDKEGKLIFFEVKTRSNELFGDGIESIDIRKQKHIYKTVEYYLYIKKNENMNIRIDGIEVFLGTNKTTLKHYYNIILESPYS